MTGRLAKTITDKHFEEGEHSIESNAADVKAGVYFLQMESTGFSEIKKLIVLK